MNPHVTLEVPERWESAPVGHPLPLRLVVSRPADQVGAVAIRTIDTQAKDRVLVRNDLFLTDVRLRPGESSAFTVETEFQTTGPADLSDFYVQVNPEEGEPALVFLPARPFRVLPNLRSEVTVQAARVCGYEGGVKVELTIGNTGSTDWKDLEVRVGSQEQIRSGPTCFREPLFRPDGSLTFEVITDAESLEFDYSASVGDDRVTARAVCPVPATTDRPESHIPFTFLEPRNLTHDRIIIKPESGDGSVAANRGVYHVHGDKCRYIVTIFPNQRGVQRVELFGAAGVAEVERMASEGGAWIFLLTVIDDPTLSQPVRLYYDVRFAERTLRGELCLAVRPRRGKWFKLALMLGAGLTLKGLAGVVSALNDPGALWSEVMTEGPGLLSRLGSDIAFAISIPLLFALMWVANLFVRPFEDE